MINIFFHNRDKSRSTVDPSTSQTLNPSFSQPSNQPTTTPSVRPIVVSTTKPSGSGETQTPSVFPSIHLE